MEIPGNITVSAVDKYISDQLTAMLNDPYIISRRKIIILPNEQTWSYVTEKYELYNLMVDLQFVFEVAGRLPEYNKAFLKAWKVPIPDISPSVPTLDKRVQCSEDDDNNLIITFIAKCDEYNVISALCDDDYLTHHIHPWRSVQIRGRMRIPKLRDYWDAINSEYRCDIVVLMRAFPKYNRTILEMINSSLFK